MKRLSVNQNTNNNTNDKNNTKESSSSNRQPRNRSADWLLFDFEMINQRCAMLLFWLFYRRRRSCQLVRKPRSSFPLSIRFFWSIKVKGDDHKAKKAEQSLQPKKPQAASNHGGGDRSSQSVSQFVHSANVDDDVNGSETTNS